MSSERLSKQTLRPDYQFLNQYKRQRQTRLGQAVIIFDDVSKNAIDHRINNCNSACSEYDIEPEYFDETFPTEHSLNTDNSLQQAMGCRKPRTCQPRDYGVKLPDFQTNRMPTRDSVGCHLKYRQTVSELKKDAFREWEVKHSPEYNPRKKVTKLWKQKLPNIQLSKRNNDDGLDYIQQINNPETHIENLNDDVFDDSIGVRDLFAFSKMTIDEKDDCNDDNGIGDGFKVKDIRQTPLWLWAHGGDPPWLQKHSHEANRGDVGVNEVPGGSGGLRFVGQMNTETESDYINQFLAPLEQTNRCMDVAMFGQGMQAVNRVSHDDHTGCRHYIVQAGQP